jgi:UDP-glucose 4-epimerase
MISGRALITGATGFIGSHLTRRLLNEGVEVHIVCRAHSKFSRIKDILPWVTVHFADLCDPISLRAAVRDARPDYVFHLASATSFAGASYNASNLVRVNFFGAVNLIEVCEAIGYSGMVVTGDSFEYAPSTSLLREDAPCHPSGLHGVTKLAATLKAQAVARERGSPIVILRLFSIYGPSDHSRRLIPRVIYSALAGTKLLLSSSAVTRDWVYIGDIVNLYIEAATRAGQLSGHVFNGGSGVSGSIRTVVDTILRLTNSRARPRWETFKAPPHDRHPWVADPTCTFSQFDWRPSVSLEEGLSRTIAAARAEYLT